MRIGMIGTGKLGFPVALAINGRKHDVFAYDTHPDVKEWAKGAFPFREKHLDAWIEGNTLQFCESVKDVVAQSDIVFIAIQTPHLPEYEGDDIMPADRVDFDYSYLKAGLAEAAAACKELQKKTILAVISTCLPGTFRRELKSLLNEYVSYVYTPQFIAMGTVIEDYLNPEFNLIGVADQGAAEVLCEFYYQMNDAPCILTDITTAEGIKVSYNTWITAKTVIANAWGEMCEHTGMDFNAMREAWNISTKRLISTRYMDAGMSDGGGCHPRDNIAMSWLADEVGMSYNIWDSLMQARQYYEAFHASVAARAVADTGLPLVLLGRSFKPETDIEVGSPAILMANILTRRGMQFLHVNDLDFLPPAVYFIATQNERYKRYAFPPGSVVLDPFGYIPDIPGVAVERLGRR